MRAAVGNLIYQRQEVPCPERAARATRAVSWAGGHVEEFSDDSQHERHPIMDAEFAIEPLAMGTNGAGRYLKINARTGTT